LVGRDWRQALGLEQLDAGLVLAEVGLETAEDDGGRRAEVKDLGVPLNWSVKFSGNGSASMPCP
jgi:hypothetical protein